ncbi:hypothetical protein H0E87_017044 [Populus deltoides]|uniref:Uncharacterized protein n=1 Tax=Populus deltoides TaxID=3696 RepID=A0A8T2XYV5_POPDE|nr:hypothetical protein H0E87_017044 [Populus deltoides]
MVKQYFRYVSWKSHMNLLKSKWYARVFLCAFPSLKLRGNFFLPPVILFGAFRLGFLHAFPSPKLQADGSFYFSSSNMVWVWGLSAGDAIAFSWLRLLYQLLLRLGQAGLHSFFCFSFGFWGWWVFFCSGLVCCVLPLAGFHLVQVDFGFGQLSKLGQKIEVAFSAFPLA